ncbi:MAG: hypothetical protein IJ794_16595 [Lachnospiraceae bacterium]|nr:hypothetical protein [Lachnospiraceae bacterium]
MKSKKRTLVLFYVLFPLIGLGLMVGGWFFLMNTQRFHKTAVEITATISSIERYTDSDGDVHHRVYIDYDFDGVHYGDVRLGEYSSSMYEGKQLTLLADPADPLNVQGKNSGYVVSIVLLVMGLVFAAIGLVPAILSVLNKNKGKKLMQEGRHIQGVVESIELNPNFSVNGRNPYIIICTYQDIYTGVTYRFKSDNLWTNPAPVFPVGDFIDVYVQGDDFSKYHVDAESKLEGKIVDYT